MICRPIPKEDCYELVEPLIFWVDYRRCVVPAGFKFKGSIPRLFWTPVTNPYDPRCARGFAIHDYLYEAKICSKEHADLKLKQCLLNDRCSKELAETIYSAVKMFGKHNWEIADGK